MLGDAGTHIVQAQATPLEGALFVSQMGAMPEDHHSDDSGSQNPGRAVRFVDTDLSINPSSHTAQDGAAPRAADRYYKDVQSIHGDMVRLGFHHQMFEPSPATSVCGSTRRYGNAPSASGPSEALRHSFERS
jgi:hypothetical protein